MTVETRNPCPAAVVSCWSCKGPVAARALFCSVCGAVQPPGQIDHFTRLGLRHTFEINIEELEHHYFAFQRRVHPDRFAARTGRERALSQAQATALNDAYETLKDPLKRAAYLLKLRGHAVDVDNAATISDPELLMESMEMRERLAEAGSTAEIDRIAADTDSHIIACQCGISAAFQQEDLDRAGALTTRLKYLTKLAEEARLRKARMTRA